MNEGIKNILSAAFESILIAAMIVSASTLVMSILMYVY